MQGIGDSQHSDLKLTFNDGTHADLTSSHLDDKLIKQHKKLKLV